MSDAKNEPGPEDPLRAYRDGDGANVSETKNDADEAEQTLAQRLGYRIGPLFPSQFRKLETKRLKFFQVWDVERRLLGQDTQPGTAQPDGKLSATHPQLDEVDFNKAFGNHGFAIPEGGSEAYLKRGLDTDKRKKTLGLALSGGGIRAASFSLGVMQGLNVESDAPGSHSNENTDSHGQERKSRPATWLDHIDYMSTVSGGGYAGSALTYYRRNARYAAKAESGNESDEAPKIEKKDREHIDFGSFPKPEAEVLNRDESRLLDFTRFRRNHLTPTTNLNLVSMAAVASASILFAWAIYFSLLSAAMIVPTVIANLAFHDESVMAGILQPLTDSVLALIPGCKDGCNTPQLRLSLFSMLFVALLFVWLVFSLTFWSVVDRWSEDLQYKWRLGDQKLFGWLLLALLSGFAFFLVTLLSAGFAEEPAWLASGVVAGNTVAAISLSSLQQGSIKRRLFSPRIVLFVSAIVLLVTNLWLSFELARLLWSGSHVIPIVFVVIGIGFALFTDINYVSLTRMYRDRLMEAFMPDTEAAVQKKNNRPAKQVDRLSLWDCQQRPLHLINTNIVLSTSQNSRYRGRSGDNFILAPHYSGSWITGYRLTRDFSFRDDTEPPPSESEAAENGIGLATAMAISGAAFSPRVGPSGWNTAMRNPLIGSMASFLNLRLGFWLANPKSKQQRRRATFWNAGLRGIFNAWFDEDRHLVELTDGGHFENTGLFELLRRRVDVIILADASADRAFNFKDIGIAIERARVDQSVDIRFLDGELDLTHLMPGSVDETHYDKRYDLAARGYAVASIRYPAFSYELFPNGPTMEVQEKYGVLVYIKPSVTRNMPADIYSYKGAHPEFPYQPITDQNFDESQFEAYREMGFHITQEMISEEKTPLKRWLTETFEGFVWGPNEPATQNED